MALFARRDEKKRTESALFAFIFLGYISWWIYRMILFGGRLSGLALWWKKMSFGLS